MYALYIALYFAKEKVLKRKLESHKKFLFSRVTERMILLKLKGFPSFLSTILISRKKYVKLQYQQ